jgi:hypothetical protein
LNLLNVIHNRFSTAAFLVNSLPKSGTNLLAKVVEQFPGVRAGGLHIGLSTLAKFNDSPGSEGPFVYIGIDCPQPIPHTALRQSLQRLRTGQYATAHIPYSKFTADLLLEMGIRSLLMIRDPRDVVVSHAHYVARTRDHFLFEYYKSLTASERIMKSIIGVGHIFSNGPVLLDICERCRSVQGWNSQPLNYSTKFESLVGLQGGGSQDLQIDEITNIAHHLGVWIDPAKTERIGMHIFGGTSTFRRGKIGSWQFNFSEVHKDAFKEIAGKLLIELGYEKDFDW